MFLAPQCLSTLLWNPLILNLAAIVVIGGVVAVTVYSARSEMETVEPVASLRLAWASL